MLRREGPELKRWLYVTEDIARTLDGTAGTPHFPDAAADVQNAKYSSGYLINVSEQKKEWGKNQGPQLERVHNVDEVWMMCFRTPPPGWRLFGRFLCKDVFVGLILVEKFDVVRKYEETGRQAIADWERILSEDPLRSSDLDDYIGPVWNNLDEEEKQQ